MEHVSPPLSGGIPVDLEKPGMERVAIGDPGIVDVQVPGKERLRLLPKAHGKTTMMLWSGEGLPQQYELLVTGP